MPTLPVKMIMKKLLKVVYWILTVAFTTYQFMMSMVIEHSNAPVTVHRNVVFIKQHDTTMHTYTGTTLLMTLSSDPPSASMAKSTTNTTVYNIITTTSTVTITSIFIYNCMCICHYYRYYIK